MIIEWRVARARCGARVEPCAFAVAQFCNSNWQLPKDWRLVCFYRHILLRAAVRIVVLFRLPAARYIICLCFCLREKSGASLHHSICTVPTHYTHLQVERAERRLGGSSVYRAHAEPDKTLEALGTRKLSRI